MTIDHEPGDLNFGMRWERYGNEWLGVGPMGEVRFPAPLGVRWEDWARANERTILNWLARAANGSA